MLKNIRLLYLHNFLNDLRFQEAFLAIYFAQITGSYTSGMAVFAVATITSAIMDIPTGILSDRMGRRFTLVLASLCSTLGIACFAFAAGAWMLFVGATLCGLSQCLINGNNDALLYETLKTEGMEKRFPHYQGRAKGMYQAGLALSALAASFLTGNGLHLVFVLGIVPQALSIFVSLLFDEPKVHVQKPKKNLAHLKEACVQIYRNPRLMVLVIAQAISYGAGESKYQFQVAFFNVLWPTWALGLYRAMGHSFGVLGFWVAGSVLARFKETTMLVVRDVYWFVTQMTGVILSNFFTPFLFGTGTFVYGIGMVARDHLLQKEFSDEQRATMGSVASFAGSIVFSLVAFGLGIISDHFGLATGVGFGVAMTVTSLPLYIWLFRKKFGHEI